jgi:hypothetical protein
MQSAILRQSLDGDDLFATDGFDNGLARSNGLVVDKNRASAAEAFTAPVLGPRQSQISAQNPQQLPIAVHGQFGGFAVESKLHGFFHNKLLGSYR